MFLKSLKIEDSKKTIREISFHKGLNLIIDETPSGGKESGNNVGKTTVLRLIHFCLGGEGKNIYTDTEFKDKNNNTLIEKFLTENDIIITLTLTDSIEDANSRTIEIRRNFQKSTNRILEVNGESVLVKDFDSILKELIFDTKISKPTFKQIISKNVRDEKNRLIHTLKVLNSFTTKEEYEALYLFWLGINTDALDQKYKYQKQKAVEDSLRNRLKKDGTYSQIEQSLTVINRSIEELAARKNSFNINATYEEDINVLNSVKSEISRTSTRLSRYEIRKSLILESQKDLEKEYSEIDVHQVKALYDSAQSYIPSLQISFQETLTFHNNMVKEKIKFISSELPFIEQELSILKTTLSKLNASENELSKKLQKAGAIEELNTVITELNIAFEKKGQLEEQKRLWDKSNASLEKINSELKSINDGISSKDDLIAERIKEFNKHFSDISYRLYGERFILSSDKTDRGYELNIGTIIGGNLGTGKKKGQIASFDFAYIEFADSLDIKCLHFILHDQIENIHDNQINSIVNDVVNSINCQYIVPVLRDKLPPEINIDQFKVLSLSQSNKLFKI